MYVIQSRETEDDIWATHRRDETADAVVVGKNHAYEAMEVLKANHPGQQFRLLPKPEADCYTAGVHDARRQAEEGSTGRAHERRPLRYLPDHL
jgi:hypothetical protein